MYSYLKDKFILEIDIRPRNINWQDWKYTSFVITGRQKAVGYMI